MPTELERRARDRRVAEVTSVPMDTMDRLLTGRATEGDQMLAYNALAALQAQQPGAQAVAERMAPVQGFSAGIPWSLHLEAYDAYSKKWRPQQALIEGGCRGGFSVDELDAFIPGWRDRASEIARLRAEVAELRKAQPPSIPEPSEYEVEAARVAYESLPVPASSDERWMYAFTTYTARLRERIGGGA